MNTRLEKILNKLEKMMFGAEVYNDDFNGTYIGNLLCLGDVRAVLEDYINDGWIPVEERLPEEPKENPEFEGKKIELYLVTVKGTKYSFRAMWNGKFFTDGWSKCNVIAWCPLPEPYKPERSEGE